MDSFGLRWVDHNRLRSFSRRRVLFAVEAHGPVLGIVIRFENRVRLAIEVAENLGRGRTELDIGILDRLSLPKRAFMVSVPVRLDNNDTVVFQGFRVQHHITSGPAKGGHWEITGDDHE